MFRILSDTIRTATQGSKPRHQRLSHEEWQNRFLSRKRAEEHELRRLSDRNRALW